MQEHTFHPPLWAYSQRGRTIQDRQDQRRRHSPLRMIHVHEGVEKNIHNEPVEGGKSQTEPGVRRDIPGDPCDVNCVKHDPEECEEKKPGEEVRCSVVRPEPERIDKVCPGHAQRLDRYPGIPPPGNHKESQVQEREVCEQPCRVHFAGAEEKRGKEPPEASNQGHDNRVVAECLRKCDHRDCRHENECQWLRKNVIIIERRVRRQIENGNPGSDKPLCKDLEAAGGAPGRSHKQRQPEKDANHDTNRLRNPVIRKCVLEEEPDPQDQCKRTDPVEEFPSDQGFPFLFCTGFHGRGSRRRGGDGGCDRSLNLIPGESGDFRSSADTRPPRRKALPEATAGFLRRHSICSSRFPDRLFELPDETESRSKPLLQIREARGENAHPREHDRQRDNDDQDTEQKERHHGAPVRVGNTNAGRSYAKIVFSYRRINEEGGPVPLFPHILAYSSHTQYI